MNCEIITVGTELLLGEILDTNTQFLSRELAELGINVLYQTSVGDNESRLESAYKLAFSRSDIVILTGGIGPTSDDITKETVAKVLDLPLEFNQYSYDRIEEYFLRRNLSCTKSNRKQAYFPKGSIIIPNESGTAPGCLVIANNKLTVILPGPPSELIPMFKRSVYPYLKRHIGSTIVSKNFRLFGVGESRAEEIIGNLVKLENPTIAFYAGKGEVRIRITAKAANRHEAEDMLIPVENEIYARLEQYVYGYDDDSLEIVLVGLLSENEMKVAVAESCTGGLISQKITSVAGASKVLESSFVTYSNDAKTKLLGVPKKVLKSEGAVSDRVARLMAEGVRKEAKADIGISATGIAGPDGGTDEKPVGTVYIAVSLKDKTIARRLNLGRGGPGEREYIRELTAMNALDLARRAILNESEGLPFMVERNNNEGNADLDPDRNITHSEQDNDAITNANSNGGKIKNFFSNFGKKILPWRGDGFGEILRKTIFLASIIIFAVSAFKIVSNILAVRHMENMIDSMRQTYQTPPTQSQLDNLPDGALPQFASLIAKNDEVIGWVTVPNTNISCAVTQTTDNDKYLYDYDWQGQPSEYGSVFADYRGKITKDRVPENIILYGHNFSATSKNFFTELINYQNFSFYKERPVIHFDTIYEEMNWKIISIFLTNTLPQHGEVFDYHNTIYINNEEDFNDYTSKILERSLVVTGVDVEYGDQLLTLSTCQPRWFLEGRFVVVARKVREGESIDVDVDSAYWNPNPVMPDVWYENNYGAIPQQ